MNSINNLIKSSKIWYARQHQIHQPKRTTGFARLDHALMGGWPQSGLIELGYEGSGSGELALVLPSLTQQTVAAEKMIFMVNPPFLLNPWQLNEQGLNLNQLYICNEPEHALWLTEQALSHALCEAVLLWHGHLNRQQCRRLKLASEKGNSRCFWLHDSQLDAKQKNSEANVKLKLKLAPPHLLVTVTKITGAMAGTSLQLDIFEQLAGHRR
ncbi:hypothetical protein [Gayadomonas joobiniege]|uniref:hypothetical protein n=1 Tax=Gayadomonas joobiniege TaxID=1234606 RepID=UPI00037B160F|nr:hypothetical protein [Gayadomonas joobiniege]